MWGKECQHRVGLSLIAGPDGGEYRQRSAHARYNRHEVMEVWLHLFFHSVVIEVGCFNAGERILDKHKHKLRGSQSRPGYFGEEYLFL